MRLGTTAALAVLLASGAAGQEPPATVPGPVPAPGAELVPGPVDRVDPGAAGPPELVLAAAVADYEAGRFVEAERALRSLLAAGVVRANVLFDMGNAAYRRGEWAVAVYAYEWALHLDPADAQVRENLALARSRLVVDQVPTDVPAAVREALDLAARVPVAATLAGLLALWTGGWLLLAWRQRGGPSGATWGGVALIVASLAFGAHVAWRAHHAHGPARGVLLRSEVEVKSGPGADYATLFRLHAGTVVVQDDQRPGWRRVHVPQGPGGWIPAGQVALFGRIETLPPLPGS